MSTLIDDSTARFIVCSHLVENQWVELVRGEDDLNVAVQQLLPHLDLAVSKTTAFNERFEREFVWEIFNLTNTVKLGDPGTEFNPDEFGFIGWYRSVGAYTHKR